MQVKRKTLKSKRVLIYIVLLFIISALIYSVLRRSDTASTIASEEIESFTPQNMSQSSVVGETVFSKSLEELEINSVNSSASKIDPTDYKIVPVIFFPTNYPVDNQVVSHVQNSLLKIQKWFELQNDGKTFNIDSSVVINGKHDSFWYWCKKNESECIPDNTYANIFPEMREKGLKPLDPDNLNIKYLLIFMGGGGFASGYMTNSGAVATLGDISIYPELDKNCNRVKPFYFQGDSINSFDRCINERMASTNQGTGAIAHELGHTFLLPHTIDSGYAPGSYEAQNSLMQNHGIFPDNILAPREKEILSNSPFLTAKSGNIKTPTPTKKVNGTPTQTLTSTVTPTKIILPTKVLTPTAVVTNTPKPISCDPYSDGESAGRVDIQDVALVRDEVSRKVRTNKGSCLTGAPYDSTKITDLIRARRLASRLD